MIYEKDHAHGVRPKVKIRILYHYILKNILITLDTRTKGVTARRRRAPPYYPEEEKTV